MTNLHTAERLAEVTGGGLVLGRGADARSPLAGAIVADARAVQPGDWFWAIEDSEHGNNPALAWQQGAGGVIAKAWTSEVPAGRFVVLVQDTEQALLAWANYCRREFQGMLILVAGPERRAAATMIDTVLGVALRGNRLVAQGGFDGSELLQMAAVEPEQDYAIICLGHEGREQVADQLASYGPGIVAISSPCQVAAEQLSERDKQQIPAVLRQLVASAVAVLPGDDPGMRRLAAGCAARTVWVGRDARCNPAAAAVTHRGGRLQFITGGQAFSIPGCGRHQLGAVLTALAVGIEFGRPLGEIAAALASHRAPRGSGQVTTAGGVTLVDQSAMSAWESPRGAFEALRECTGRGQRIIVLGDPGENVDAENRVGRDVVTACGADLLVTCGDGHERVVAAARRAGMPANRIAACHDVVAAASTLQSRATPGDTVLLRGRQTAMVRRALETGNCPAALRAAA